MAKKFSVLVIAATICLAHSAHALNKVASLDLRAGYNDNVENAASGRPEHDGSLLANAFFNMKLDGRTESIDSLYLDLDGDLNFYLTEADASSLLFHLNPGLKFKALKNNLETDIGYHFRQNLDFERSDEQRLTGRPRNPLHVLWPMNRTIGDSFSAHELSVASLLFLDQVRVGPVLRFGSLDYYDIPQKDSYVTVAGRMLIDITRSSYFAFDLGYVSDNSERDGFSYTGFFFSPEFKAALSPMFSLEGSYLYTSRDYSGNEREDTSHVLTLGFAARLRGDLALNFDYVRTANDSNWDFYEFTSNVFRVGARLNLL